MGRHNWRRYLGVVGAGVLGGLVFGYLLEASASEGFERRFVAWVFDPRGIDRMPSPLAACLGLFFAMFCAEAAGVRPKD